MSATVLNTIHVGSLEMSPSRVLHDDCSASSDDGSVGFREEILPALKPAAISHQPPATATKVIKPVVPKATMIDAFAHVMTFLPLDDIEAARLATPLLASAADRVAPKPLPHDDIVFVRWEPQELHTTLPAHKSTRNIRATASASMAPPTMFPWRCLNCGTVTVGPRQCGSCRAPLSSSACRVFIGQIRKDLSAELAAALVRSLLPDVTILHMESHTNGVDGRGKGCAWAYVNSVEDAMRVTSLHKRVFVDLDAENGEGFWFVRDPALIGHLGAMADVLASARSRPVWLPRQPLVAELPANSMLAHFVQSMTNYSG